MRRRIRPLAALVVTAGLVWVYTYRLAPRWLQIVRLRIGVPDLPDGWVGVRVAHLSDFHVGAPGVTLEHLERARRIALDFQPDLVAITGDFYHDGVPVESGRLYRDWPKDVPVLAVLGNHDLRGGPENLRIVLGDLAAAGVRVLRNEAVSVPLRGQPAWVVGVDDPHTWKADDERAFAGLPRGEDALLYLAHSPSAVTTMPVGRARLMLCGHTHGGQLRVLPSGNIPFVKPLRRLLKEPDRRDPTIHRGVHWVRGTVLVISSGLGNSRLAARFRTRPQVVLIELAQAPQHGPACDDVSRYVEDLDPEPRIVSWFS